jgi:cob(I)alamin adenosyltransferase
LRTLREVKEIVALKIFVLLGGRIGPVAGVARDVPRFVERRVVAGKRHRPALDGDGQDGDI